MYEKPQVCPSAAVGYTWGHSNGNFVIKDTVTIRVAYSTSTSYSGYSHDFMFHIYCISALVCSTLHKISFRALQCVLVWEILKIDMGHLEKCEIQLTHKLFRNKRQGSVCRGQSFTRVT